jgi:hypothetical protein
VVTGSRRVPSHGRAAHGPSSVCREARCAHDIAQEHDVLPTDHVEAEGHISVAAAVDHSLDCTLEHDVGELVKGAHGPDDLPPIPQHDHHLFCQPSRLEERSDVTSLQGFAWRVTSQWQRMRGERTVKVLRETRSAREAEVREF